MSVGLLDLNVLIALAWPSHVHHAPAHRWFARNAAQGWATCALTQLGFVRISSNPKIIADAVPPQEALKALRRIVEHEQHVFWTDDYPLTEPHFPADRILGHRQLTDAYLLGLAVRKGGRLVTLDESISALLSAGDSRRKTIELVGP